MAGQSNSIFGTLANQFSNSDALFFDSKLSREAIHSACHALKYKFRERIYSPAITVRMFIGQVLSSGQSCRDAIARQNVWRAAGGMCPVSTDSASYVEARQRLPE